MKLSDNEPIIATTEDKLDRIKKPFQYTPNETIISNLFEQVFTKNNLNYIDNIFIRDYVDHHCPPIASAKDFFSQLKHKYDKIRYSIQAADAERVVVRWTASDNTDGIEIFQLQNQKIVEHWGNCTPGFHNNVIALTPSGAPSSCIFDGQLPEQKSRLLILVAPMRITQTAWETV